ncbi:MAG TPA: hypothetical protein PKC76_10215 [Saprospiraceae bacterium]|nr:hypothetical protein [Saprospiraceae bacterium]HMP24497.1 hypothetical protein [Saprospiraceae bacterium]
MSDVTLPIENVQVEILVEERSMKNVLDIILPQVLPTGYQLGVNCFIRPHEGKQDLQKQIPGKLRAYQNMSKSFKVLIVQDQDSNDCVALKSKLIKLVAPYTDVTTVVRIACRELEAWYLGDMAALEKVYPKFKAPKYASRAIFRNPDAVMNPAAELKKLFLPFKKYRLLLKCPII